MAVIYYKFSAARVLEEANAGWRMTADEDVMSQYKVVATGDETCEVRCNDQRAAAFFLHEVELPCEILK